MNFSELGVDAALARAVADLGFTVPTPIQAQAIPVVLKGGDLLAAAQTGTGKTAAFMLPLMSRLMQGTSRREPRALVLTPTRELASQIADDASAYGRHARLRNTLIFGGVSARPQEAALRRGVDIVIATPGRLLDHASTRTIDLSHVEILVLDEADRMLDMGFIRDIRRILALLPAKRQNLLFSATFSPEIRGLAGSLLHAPATVDVAPRNSTAERVEQRIYHCDKSRKQPLLSYLIGNGNWRQVLVFTRTKHGADRLAKQLERDGLTSAAIHGNKSQNARTRALADFKANRVRVLVATDIAARGIDIVELPHVVNYELPHVPEDYVHRIGRTGRNGCEGEAISLVSEDERGQLRDIERLLKRSLPVTEQAGFTLSRPPSGEVRRPAKSPTKPNNARAEDGNKSGAPGQKRRRRPRRDGQAPHSGHAHPSKTKDRA